MAHRFPGLGIAHLVRNRLNGNDSIGSLTQGVLSHKITFWYCTPNAAEKAGAVPVTSPILLTGDMTCRKWTWSRLTGGGTIMMACVFVWIWSDVRLA
jgi:hypothetical protein